MVSLTTEKRIRYNFGSVASVTSMPNLIQVQKRSYEGFLQLDKTSENRKDKGLESVLKSIFPLSDYDEKATLEYVKYELDSPKYEKEECVQRGVSFASPLRVTLRLIVWDIDEEIGTKEIKGIKEQDVYMGEILLMTENGTFIINGAQRVIVSQMHRSPGVFYSHDDGKNGASGKYLYSVRIIPYRGSWLDFEFDAKDILYFRIDKKRKIHITTLLKALGYSKEDILEEFYDIKAYTKVGDQFIAKFNIEDFKGLRLEEDIINYDNSKVLLPKGERVTLRVRKNLSDMKGISYVASKNEIIGKFVAEIVKNDDGEVILNLGEEVTEQAFDMINESNITELKLLNIDSSKNGPEMRSTLLLDKNDTKEEALADIYKVLRPGEPSTPEVAEALFYSVFFSSERYDLSPVGRMKINMKHSLNIDENLTVLTKEDILAILKHVIEIKNTVGEVDDIDNLANRRVRSVGELVENQFRLGLIRMQKSIVERMGTVEIDSVMPHDLVNSKALMSVIREFFGTSQLSQFMDQTNPLSEITHKRRLSALGPGGLTRERAGFEVRDVHPTHYSRICPIETPEGQNIGLISSLAIYADIDKFGFIQSPYRKVVNEVITDKVEYLTAIEEEKFTIAQANAKIMPDGSFANNIITSRKKGEIITAKPNEINYIDVSPKQLVSVAASLIPFLENDDANRALMGSNMQRQAVPLIKSNAPVVGTGMEASVAKDSGAVIVAKRNGIVDKVDANRIVVKVKNEGDEEVSGVDIYNLVKYKKSNQSTCVNQRPIIKQGDVIKQGDILADGPSTDLGELALGKNVLVTFMPWNGYNFEDSILISERLVSNDTFTSIHIKEYEVIARDTRLGPEEITRDIPNVNEENLNHLDEVGIVHVGAKIKSGDILIGKVTPKTESPLTPEEKLLRAIFGEKAADVRDSSLRVSPGDNGTVIDVKVFTRRGVEKDERALIIEHAEIERLTKDKDDQIRIIEEYVYTKLKTLLLNKKILEAPKNSDKVLNEEFLSNFSRKQLWQIVIQDEESMKEIQQLKDFLDSTLLDLKKRYEKRIEKVQSGDDLPQGALKVVKIYIATKLKLQPGDKMAGRHGNKGVVSRIVPIEDMPFLEDGTPVDVVLNPLGVPSRMNIGQILETHLGWASINIAKQVSEALGKVSEKLGENNLMDLRNKLIEVYSLHESHRDPSIDEKIMSMSNDALLDFARNMEKGMYFSSPVFDGAKEKDLDIILEKAGIDTSGQVQLRDGRTGEEFGRKVTIGYIYMLKLDHLVDNKIHARSIGPYSLVTQQPLGGKSHFGGQRFGEMECWALQGYGAAYSLQEILTVKSDDVTGRVRTYEAIIRGDNSFDPGTPESFKVMIKELRSLALNVEMRELDNTKNLNFDEIKISIATPEKIRSWSYGEVKRPDTVNYRTIKPENNGLFCARIFGPVKDYECICGKYKRMKYRGTVCEKCGVEVTTSKVRRERMGHIELATPVVHIWFLRSLPSRISTLLDIPLKNIEKVLYFESYIVKDPGITTYEYGQLLTEAEYNNSIDRYGEDAFHAGMGAEIIKKMLEGIDLLEEKKSLREELVSSNSETKRRKIVRRLKLIEDFIESGNKPEMMVLEVLPVIPPDLRPLVMLDGGRFATSDLNELYRRVINRNNRLKRLIELNAPDIIIRNEKRMLQEAVDALFDNSRRSKVIKNSNKRPLKSLSDMLKGKQGRFRQNLLGKRVDYSGRSVIVVGPELKLHQCGIPKRMALELFKPFVYSKLESYGISTTLKSAKKMVETERPEVWDILEEVIREHPVLLNRAPTLHRLGIQAFEPILIEGKAIQLHPLVCTPFNADFDGDMMAVHVPLSIESQLEARVLMMSTNNILSPANGKPIIVPSQDIILGLYYLSLMFDGEKGEGMVFKDIAEIEHALNSGKLSIHAKIKYKKMRIDVDDNIVEHLMLTTPGRVIISDLLPKEMETRFDYVNKIMNKKEVSNLIDIVYRYCGQKKSVIFSDQLMQLGFFYACKSGISIGKNDMVIPHSKAKHVENTLNEVREYENQYADGLITTGEKYNKVVDAWSRCTDKIANDMMRIISKTPTTTKKQRGFSAINSVYMMADSGARGSTAQMKQLSGMRGLMTKPSGEIIETPIISNF